MTQLAYLGLMVIVSAAVSVVSAVLDSVHPQATREVFRLLATAFVVTACWKVLTGKYSW